MINNLSLIPTVEARAAVSSLALLISNNSGKPSLTITSDGLYDYCDGDSWRSCTTTMNFFKIFFQRMALNGHIHFQAIINKLFTTLAKFYFYRSFTIIRKLDNS
ncbi:hypothetical protein ACTA71_007571 [Dictyostelium dimigraforme]